MWEFFKRENSFIESCLSLSRMRKCITAAVTAKVIEYKSCSELSLLEYLGWHKVVIIEEL